MHEYLGQSRIDEIDLDTVRLQKSLHLNSNYLFFMYDTIFIKYKNMILTYMIYRWKYRSTPLKSTNIIV